MRVLPSSIIAGKIDRMRSILGPFMGPIEIGPIIADRIDRGRSILGPFIDEGFTLIYNRWQARFLAWDRL